MKFAIVGMECLLPGSPDAESWIERSRNGEPALSEVPESRWPVDADQLCVGANGVPGRSAARVGGFVHSGVPEIRDLDVAPARLDSLDPLFRWVLHTVQSAVRQVPSWSPHRSALFLANLGLPSTGLVRATAPRFLEALDTHASWLKTADPRNLKQAHLPAMLTARLLGIDGEVTALDAACASGLYGVRIALDRLRTGACDVAIAASVQRSDPAYLMVGFSQLRALSPTGTPRPLDRAANGLVVGEGAAAVVLKRLDDAMRDGDDVLAVVRDGALGNDGKTGNLLAPSPDGQLRTLLAAWEKTELDPRSLGYVECHATGTPVGDPIEVRALQSLVDILGGPATNRPIALGSAKELIGHTITTAGLAGLIRTVGAVRDGFLPVTRVTDPVAPLAESRDFRVVSASEPWDDPVRRAAVSAFGFGGTNAHLIVESAPESRPTPADTVVPITRSALAVVGIGIRLGPLADGEALSALASGRDLREAAPPELTRGANITATGTWMAETAVDATRFRIPPVELGDMLLQQLTVLQSGDDATEGLDLPTRTASIIGTSLDPHISEPILRIALQGSGDSIAPELKAQRVQGSLPNFVANRLASQLDLQGPSYTVSADRLSGLVALHHAAALLASGEVDAALVGAVDFPGHLATLEDGGAECAIVLAVKRLEDADESEVIATVDDIVLAREITPLEPTEMAIHRDQVGDAGAADGLLSLVHGIVRGGRRVQRTETDSGYEASWVVTRGAAPLPSVHRTPSLTVPHSPGRMVSEGWTGPWGTDRVPLPRPNVAPRPIVRFHGPVQQKTRLDWSGWVGQPTPQTAPPRPTSPPPRPMSPPPRPASPPPRVRPAPRQASMPAGAVSHQELAQLAGQLAATNQALTAAHEAFLANERRGLQELQRIASVIDRAAGQLQSGHGQLPELPRPAAPRPSSPPAAPKTAPETPAPSSFPNRPTDGPAYDYDQLLAHASGKISECFGPAWADLDPYEPRVRMPEPPLLLCSRVVEIEGTRGDLGAARIVTEYDIPEEAWWSHDGKAPPCVVVESGQADLFLVSYLGVDEICQGERVYRLLDCDLTFHGERPKLGETLRHDIRIKRFARLGGTVLFYFEYDCVSATDGRPVLSMRNGCAGFFTPAELARPKGLPDLPPHDDADPVPPLIGGAPKVLDEEAIAALTAGRFADALGHDFTSADGSPLVLNPSAWRVVHRVRELSTSGGAHGLGGLVAEQDLRDDDWFNDCHFKGDPCMPGTLMFDGCVQALQVWLIAAGWPAEYPLKGTFEPIDGLAARLRCRGQIVPGHSLATYEVRVRKAGTTPHPWAIADVILSVDGTPVVIAHDVGVRIVGDRVPLPEHTPHATAGLTVRSVDKPHVFEYSIGDTVRAFDKRWDVGHRVARMPGPPYLFMSEIERAEGPHGEEASDRTVVCRYDVPADAWYFDSDPDSSMPWAILLEIALQPCGWLTAWQASSLAGRDLYFRNLGGTAKQVGEVHPWTGPLHTTVTQTRVARSSGMSLHFFDIEVTAGGQPIFVGDTYFGYFSADALGDQKGLDHDASWEEMRQASERGPGIDPNRDGMPRADWQMLDRITIADTTGGRSELGYYEAEKDVNAAEWFFTAHFYLDPVMPGSLGLEALLQLARWVLMDRVGPIEGHIEPMLLDDESTWTYRGQVVLSKEVVSYELEVIELVDGDTPMIRCNGVLRADGLPIYRWENFGLRVVPEAPSAPVLPPPKRPSPEAALLDSFDVQTDGATGVLRLDPEVHPWLADHRPTLTIPAVPMAFAAEIAAEAAQLIHPDKTVVGIKDLRAQQWIHTGEGPLDLIVVAVTDGRRVAVTLSVHHENLRYPKLSGPKVHMQAVVDMSTRYPVPPETPDPVDAPEVELSAEDYYTGCHTFHGPSLQGMTSLGRRDEWEAEAIFHTKPDSELLGPGMPRFLLDPLLLDTATHPMMSATPEIWVPRLKPGRLAYPVHAEKMVFYGPRPSGEVRCQLNKVKGDPGQIRFDVTLIGDTGVWCTFRWTEALVGAGPLLEHPAAVRKAFLLDGIPDPDVVVGQATERGWVVEKHDLIEPLEGTTVQLLCTDVEVEEWRRSEDRERWTLARIAAKEAARHWLRERLDRDVHPRSLEILQMRHDLCVVAEAAGLTAQEYVDHIGPTRYDLHLAPTRHGFEAWVTGR